MNRGTITTVWCLITLFTVGIAEYCEEAFKPQNATGKTVKFCITNSQTNSLEIYLEVEGTEDPGVTCTCDFEYTNSHALGSLGYGLIQEKEDSSEIRVGNAISTPDVVSFSFSENIHNTTITFTKSTGTSRMCLLIAAGQRFDIYCKKPDYQSSVSTPTSRSSTNSPTTDKVTFGPTSDVTSGNANGVHTTDKICFGSTSDVTSGNDPGVIAGAFLGGCAVATAVTITVFICMRKRPFFNQKQRATEMERNAYLNVNVQYENTAAFENDTVTDTNRQNTDGPDRKADLNVNGQYENTVAFENDAVTDTKSRNTDRPEYTTLVEANKCSDNYSKLHFPKPDKAADANDDIVIITETFVDTGRNKV